VSNPATYVDRRYDLRAAIAGKPGSLTFKRSCLKIFSGFILDLLDFSFIDLIQDCVKLFRSV
jgi:hypothetical protein